MVSGLLAQSQPVAVNAAPSVIILDGSAPRKFEIATDELVISTAGGQDSVQKFAPLGTTNSVRRHAEEVEAATGEEASVVLYEAGVARKESTRRILTTGVVVKVVPGTDAEALARSANATLAQKNPFNTDYIILDAGKPGAALDVAAKVRGLPGVVSAEPMLARQQTKRRAPNDPLFAQQWHLRNVGQKGGLRRTDVNVMPVWNRFRGHGIRIGIVDDGVQTRHPDLVRNVDTINDFDWNNHDFDANPAVGIDDHGTPCAGVAAGRGFNLNGGTGVAPMATIVGMRLISAATTDQQEADAMSYRNDIIQIKSNSWGPDDDGFTVEAPGPLLEAAFEDACRNGRGGLGTIFTWAAGNGRAVNDNSNFDGYANNIHTIAVTAVSDRGTQTDYSEPGANIVIATPSGSQGRQSITTTDLMGRFGDNTNGRAPEPGNANFTNSFSGTSSATPLAAGVVALMLQSRPTLGWRDVQEILMRSARMCSPTDGDWTYNGAGLKFNHKFGAGLIDATAAVTYATYWNNLGPQTNVVRNNPSINTAIPDADGGGVTETFTVANNIRVEHVTVQVNISHSYRGDLQVVLVSPSGTTSRLAEPRRDSGDGFTNWKFMTVRNWGESSGGTWTLIVRDLAAEDVGTLESAKLTVYGS